MTRRSDTDRLQHMLAHSEEQPARPARSYPRRSGHRSNAAILCLSGCWRLSDRRQDVSAKHFGKHTQKSLGSKLPA